MSKKETEGKKRRKGRINEGKERIGKKEREGGKEREG